MLMKVRGYDQKYILLIVPMVKVRKVTICSEAIWHIGQPIPSDLLNQMLIETMWVQISRRKRQGQTENKITIKPATYDGSSSWLDYKCHFESCVNVNGWSEEKKGLFLALSLRSQAHAVLSDLPSESRQHYETLVRSLHDKFSPPNQTD